MNMIESFDIFDTCLMRDVAEPECIFDILAAELGLAPGYKAVRMQAEREAVRRYGEPTLPQIYGITGEWCLWSAAVTGKYCEAELRIESEHLFGVPEMRVAVDEVRTAGKRIVFLSDTYFSSDFLKRMLEREGFYREGDLLLASCEQGTSKRGGGLYGVAADQLGSAAWRHTGNCRTADVDSAKKHGLNADHFHWGNLTRYERILCERTDAIPESAAWASAAREARISMGALGGDERVIARVSSAVAGPFALLFTDWIASKAARLGIGNLFFLARDGQALVEPFTRIAGARGLPLSAGYLYASRISWRFPKEFPISERDARWLFQCGRDWIQSSVVAARLGVSERELISWLPSSVIKDGTLLLTKTDEILASLATEAVMKVLRESADKRESLWLEYLVQQGVTRHNHIGIVDLGWNGSLQIALEELFKKHGIATRVTGFYFGLQNAPEAACMDAHAYAFDHRLPAAKESAMVDTTLAELFMHADHGSTLGYQRTEQGELIPILDGKDGTSTVVPNWLDLHREAINIFVDRVIIKDALPAAAPACLPLLYRLIEEFWRFPGAEEARVWGSLAFSSDGLQATQILIVSQVSSPRDLIWVLGSGMLGRGRTQWREGGGALLPAKLDRVSRCFSALKLGYPSSRALLRFLRNPEP